MNQPILSQLLQGVEVLRTVGTCNDPVAGITADSRAVVAGGCFVALCGTQQDGHRYIPAAVAAGAKVIICQTLPDAPADGVCYVEVSDTAEALGEVASAYYGHPSRELRLVGITGTNGKTTTVTLLYDLVRALGYRAGLISTVIYKVDERTYPSTHTTPDPVRLNALLRDMVDAGCDYCFMECSSHAIVQRRIGGLRFAGGLFSNITHDHLDYHKTFAAYIRAKKSFFDALPREAFAVTNLDDRNGMVMMQNCAARVRTMSLRSAADYHGKIIEQHLDGMLLRIDGHEVWSRLVGRFNASNLLAVYAAACELGFRRDEVLCALSGLQPVSGRFEVIRAADTTTALVDYAHTPDALENVLRTIEEIRTPQQQLWVVCGCGGDRDRTKRPEMAAIAVKYASTAIFTADNPRTESPEAILDEMVAGLTPGTRYMRLVDRREAIRTAVMLSQPGDILLIAGKGHEDYQIIGTTKHHFDDREEVRAAFEAFKR